MRGIELYLVNFLIMEKVYIAGAITGLERVDYLVKFRRAEMLVKERGYKVVNPTRRGPGRWLWLYRLMGYRLTLLYDLWLVMRCDRIYLIPGWEESRGAKVESFVAYQMKVRRLPQDLKNEVDKLMGASPLERLKVDTLSRKKKEGER